MMKYVLITYEVDGPEAQVGREVERRVLAEGEAHRLCRTVKSPAELEEHEGVAYCQCGDEALARVGPDQTPLCGTHLDQYVIQRKREDV